jgi:hypothetical protein
MVITIVEQYDTTLSLYPMLKKFYFHLHPSTKSYNGLLIKEWMMTTILFYFKKTLGNAKPTKDFVNIELLVF